MNEDVTMLVNRESESAGEPTGDACGFVIAYLFIIIVIIGIDIVVLHYVVLRVIHHIVLVNHLRI